MFDPLNIDLPVASIIQEVREALARENTLIIHAPPGAGKSTLLPLALLDQSLLSGKKIIMLEPRRLAARAIASRMSQLLGEEIGNTVGYRIRFENHIGPNTIIEVVTEGVLTRMLQSDNGLEKYSLVIFDEFHERSLHADLALALCREAQQVLRPDLRIMIMSATLNMPELTSMLKATVVASSGKQFPVEIIYTQDADESLLPELAARTIVTAIQEHHGDVLLFLPGEAEIKKCAEILSDHFPDFSINPLYGMLPQSEQLKAILPDKYGKRKIVLATSIAETSLTIEGIRIVVDSGFARIQRFDPSSGLSKLETVRISKSSADQRAGRAGRLSSGVCYRMWTKATESRLPEHHIPEIMEADLSSMMLELANWGVNDIYDLFWLTPPPKASTSQAMDTLHEIAAVEKNKITAHGRQIHSLACHPRLAHMLLLAKEQKLEALACDIAAILEERDPLDRNAGADLNLRVEALRKFRKSGSIGKLGRIEKVAASYRKLLKTEEDNSPFDSFDTGLLLAYAYPERIASARPGNNAQFQLANGKIAAIGHKDDLAHQPWLAVANMDLRSGLGKIFLAAPLNPKDLLSMVKEQEIITWDTRKGGLIATKDLRIGSIVLQSKPLLNYSTERRIQAICEALRSEGETLLDFNDQVTQLQNRILSLRAWNPNEHWPDVNTQALLKNDLTWIAPYIEGVKRSDELKKIDLYEALYHSLPFEKQSLLDKLAPEKIEAPSGSKIKIEYFAHATTPVLSVRLQEVFGLEETPSVNNGKIKIVMHLLSPGYKPVQVTSDLKSFWNNMYHDVKKELQRRYPKHSWPENPWTAKPIAKGKSQKH